MKRRGVERTTAQAADMMPPARRAVLGYQRHADGAGWLRFQVMGMGGKGRWRWIYKQATALKKP